MDVYLTSYYPLCCNRAGRQTVAKHDLLPYIDGSCRREPDFQHPKPSITGLCRPGFSKKLDPGDLVIYLTNKKGLSSKRMVAILEVEHKKIGHDKAATWYRQNKFATLPNNLMVEGNDCFDLDKTHQMMGWNGWGENANTIDGWNKSYQKRADEFEDVAICKIWNGYLNIENPPGISKSNLREIFGRIPGTQNPPRLQEAEWRRFQNWLDGL